MTEKKDISKKSVWSAVKAFYSSHIIGKLFGTLVLVVLLGVSIYMIPVLQIKEKDIAKVSSDSVDKGAELEKKAGAIVLAQNGNKTLKLYSDMMILEVSDDITGEVYSSAIKDATTGSELALLSLSYLGEDNNLREWNSYDNCTLFSSYQMYQIEDGVKIVMNLNEGESNRFYEYLPKKMSIERYEEVFVGGLEKLAADGTLDDKKVRRYKQTLSLVYKKSLVEECYAVTYTGTPPATAVTQMIEIAKLVGYTQDMLIEDGETFDFTVTFTEPAVFDVTVDVVLENGELVVSMLGVEMQSENSFYSIQNVKLLPNFGAVAKTEYEEGYVFVPDGSGALMEFNSHQASIRNYERPLFDNDFFKDYSYMPEYGEELLMPVYGMLYGSMNDADKGFLAIVEEGARNGYVHVKLASPNDDSSKYNKVFVSFDVEQYKKVKLYGEYSTNPATYLVSTGMQQIPYTVRYQFFGEGASYFEMAKSYQNYLVKKNGLVCEYDAGDATLFLEVVGALSFDKRLVGIPYDSTYSMTTYQELQDMVQDLGDVNLQIQYDGALNGGMNNQLNNGADLVKENGTRKDYLALQEYLQKNNIPLYMSVALTQVGDEGNGFLASRHAVRGFDNEEVETCRYTPALGVLSNALSNIVSGESFYMISPKYLSFVTDSFLEESEEFSQLAITDMASMYYADYRFRSFITGEEADVVLNQSLEKLADAKELVLKNPHTDKLQYGEVATDVSRESSEFITFSHTIPFKQLVMNGMIDYTTTDINMSSKDSAYYVLQAAELGAWPKYLVASKNVSTLRDTAYSYLYSVQYEIFADEIKALYEECAAIRAKIGTNEIISHKTLAEGVYETTYANNVSVFVNYNLYDIVLEDSTELLAQQYLIKEGR